MNTDGPPPAANGTVAKVLVAALMATLSAFSAWTTFYVSKSWDEKESIQEDVTELHREVARASERLDGALARIERIYADLQRLENHFIERDKGLDVMLQREIDTKLAAERERLKCLEREVYGEAH